MDDLGSTEQADTVNDDDFCPGDEVAVCHVPPGNPDAKHTICVGVAAVATHVNKHGDTEGPCEGDVPPGPTLACGPGTVEENGLCVIAPWLICQCEFDSDGDGVCDDVDVCDGGNDAVDSDGDGVPDACDPDLCGIGTCPNGCCDGFTCVPFADQSNAMCGSMNASCAPCSDGFSCVGGECVCSSTVEICDDGLDNDCDGLTDCSDPACFDTSSCVFSCGTGSPTNVFTEDFADNSAGWTLDIEWQIGPATSSVSPGSCGNGDPGTDTTGTADNGIAGVVIGGNANPLIHPYRYLTSPVINAAGAPSLTLTFNRWLNSDYQPYMQNRVEVFDGSSWITVWQTAGAPGLQDAVWTPQLFDISAFANANLRVRFGFQIGSNGVFTCSQWNVDDVAIHACQ